MIKGKYVPKTELVGILLGATIAKAAEYALITTVVYFTWRFWS